MTNVSTALTRTRLARFAKQFSRSSGVNNQAAQPRRRSGLELTGAFLLIALVITAGASLHAETASSASDNSKPNDNQSGAAIKLTQTTTTPDADADSTTPSSASVTHSSQVSSHTVNGNTTVTVDGQTVPVPDNGTYQKTTTSPNGTQSTVTVSGTSGNSSVTQNTVNVNSSSVGSSYRYQMEDTDNTQ